MLPLIGFAMLTFFWLVVGVFVGIMLARSDAQRRMVARARRLQALADEERTEYQRIEALPADKREGQDLALELLEGRKLVLDAGAWSLYRAAWALDRAPLLLFWRSAGEERDHG